MSLQSERIQLLMQRLSLTEMAHGYEALAEQAAQKKVGIEVVEIDQARAVAADGAVGAGDFDGDAFNDERMQTAVLFRQ
jgi:hypothetical protein